MKKTLFLLFVLASYISHAQESPYLEKVKTLDSTLETLYSVISGEKGEKRDWELFRYLFTPEAKLIPTGKSPEGDMRYRFMSAEDYATNSGPYLEENGFFEKEIYRVTESFGPITHAFSTYESYHSEKDEKPFARGINSIQLMNDGKRWWIVNIYWFAETPDHPLPKKYLPK